MKRLLIVVVVICATAGIIGLQAQSQTENPPQVTGNARVDRLLSQMTLDEKLSLIHGGEEEIPSGVGQAGTWPGVPRLGIPSLRLSDGPPGISVSVWSTGMTATMGLAATWSREDARNNGIVIGRDAKALGQDVVLEPFVNLVRDFTFSRAQNTFGEDPFLSGQIAAAQITGTQGEGIMSQIKHYVAYDGGNDVYLDQQTLHEIYLAPFADSAPFVSSVMCSYNRVNGLYACGNGEVQNKILRGEAGFQGFITSDWGATHGTLFINEGLDLEMPRGNFFAEEVSEGRGMGGLGGGPPAGQTAAGGQGAAAGPGGAAAANPGGIPGGGFGGGRGGGGMPEEQAAAGVGTGGRGGGGRGGGSDPAPIGMKEAVSSGQVSEQTLSAAVGRILVQMDKFGLLDNAPKHSITAEDNAFNAPIVRKTAEDAATLLKNEGNVLPLSEEDLASTAFIGPTGGVLVSVGQTGERASGIPDHQLGPVPAMEQITGRELTYESANDFDGTEIPASALANGDQPGLLRTNTVSNETQTDAELNFTSANGRALPPGTSYTWTGDLRVPEDGVYTIAFQSRGATGSVSIDGNPVVSAGGGGRGGRGGNPDQPTSLSAAPRAAIANRMGMHPVSGGIVPTKDKLNNARARVELTAGSHEISVAATGEPYGNPVQVRLAWVTPQQEKGNYDAAIAAARAASKAVVFAWGRDRPEVFHLTPEQNRLIEDVAAANENTVVVLNTSLPVEMPWIDSVKGVLQMWWPGDEGGPATANILLGRANPAGRLPITWPVSLSQMVTNDPDHPERTNAGVDGRTTYSEGIFMGYRWFDQQNIAPLFPFGYGLSYTSFEYSGLEVAAATDGGLDVSFTIENIGEMAGDEVPQVYIGVPRDQPSGAQFAVRALAQFDRITVPAGESRDVTLHVEPRRLEYWSTDNDRWERATGTRTVYVAASSRDIRLQADATISAR